MCCNIKSKKKKKCSNIPTYLSIAKFLFLSFGLPAFILFQKKTEKNNSNFYVKDLLFSHSQTCNPRC